MYSKYHICDQRCTRLTLRPFRSPEAGLTAAQAAWLGSSESISRLTSTFDNLPPSFESVLRQLERVRQAKEYDEDLRDLLSEDPHLEEEMRSRTIATVVGSRLA